MKCISWNVNGLRAIMKKNFMDVLTELDPDFLCVQEIKLQEGQIDLDLEDYHVYYHYAEKKGYSGTAIFTKHLPLSVIQGTNQAEFDDEGRVLTLEYEHFYLTTCYSPNSQPNLKRLDYRVKWEEQFNTFLSELKQKKPVIVCGDLNVAHTEIDLTNPQNNHDKPGFSGQERANFQKLLDTGFTDTFRYFYPDKTEQYTWWSYRTRARQRNAGWRIDYFLVSDSLQANLESAKIYADILGSDHCPVGIELSPSLLLKEE